MAAELSTQICNTAAENTSSDDDEREKELSVGLMAASVLGNASKGNETQAVHTMQKIVSVAQKEVAQRLPAAEDLTRAADSPSDWSLVEQITEQAKQMRTANEFECVRQIGIPLVVARVVMAKCKASCGQEERAMWDDWITYEVAVALGLPPVKALQQAMVLPSAAILCLNKVAEKHGIAIVVRENREEVADDTLKAQRKFHANRAWNSLEETHKTFTLEEYGDSQEFGKVYAICTFLLGGRWQVRGEHEKAQRLISESRELGKRYGIEDTIKQMESGYKLHITLKNSFSETAKS
ncbi:hypothetical protein CJU89_4926 [Yarrowia sp. B02]|nr:hypothetical protein CJU89_4926 [Yarrowia sp. B02]